jgi:uncharacterized protein YacL
MYYAGKASIVLRKFLGYSGVYIYNNTGYMTALFMALLTKYFSTRATKSSGILANYLQKISANRLLQCGVLMGASGIVLNLISLLMLLHKPPVR